jgi:WD40 repeat protein
MKIGSSMKIDYESCSQDPTIKIWSSAYGISNTLINHTSPVYGLAILNDGNLASGSAYGTIKIWDKKTFKVLDTLENHTANVHKLAVLNNWLLVSASWDNRIIIWNDPDIIKIISGDTSPIYGLTVLNNGNFVSCSLDYTVRMWDMKI